MLSHRRHLALPLWFGLVCTLTGCDATLSVRGVVRDPHGRPIPGARLRLENAHERAGADGCFRLMKIVAQTPHQVDLEAEADGYNSLRAPVAAPGQADVQITLTQTSDTAASRLEVAPSGCPEL